MALFYRSQAMIHVTDGTAGGATPGVPGGTLRDITQYHRAGGEFSVDFTTFQRGAVGRPTSEFAYAFHQMHSISDMDVELDDTATTGTIAIFPPGDARTANPRVFRKTYRTGVSNAIGALYIGQAEKDGDGGELLATIKQRATGALVRVS